MRVIEDDLLECREVVSEVLFDLSIAVGHHWWANGLIHVRSSVFRLLPQELALMVNIPPGLIVRQILKRDLSVLLALLELDPLHLPARTDDGALPAEVVHG